MVEYEYRGYKGFDENFKCLGVQYQLGKQFTLSEGTPELCHSGIHFMVGDPLAPLFFYPPFKHGKRSRYAEVSVADYSLSSKYDRECGLTRPKAVTDHISIYSEYKLSELPASYGVKLARYNCQEWVINIGLGDKEVISSDRLLSLTLGACSVAKNTKRLAIALGASSYAVSWGPAIVGPLESLAESHTLAIALGNVRYLSENDDPLEVKQFLDVYNSCASVSADAYRGGVAFGVSYAEAVSPYAIAVTQEFARGVKHSVLVFLSPGTWSAETKSWSYPKATTVVVDGEKIKENTWYMLSDDGEPVEVPFSEDNVLVFGTITCTGDTNFNEFVV